MPPLKSGWSKSMPPDYAWIYYALKFTHYAFSISQFFAYCTHFYASQIEIMVKIDQKVITWLPFNASAKPNHLALPWHACDPICDVTLE